MSRSRRPLAAVALMLALIAFPLGALASHQFSDVPDSNPFHVDIDALVDSGVTSGCGGGNYCPSAFVTREQMAAFLNRLGALQVGKTPVVNATKVDGLDSSQFARSDLAATGHVNCLGSDMGPHVSSQAYATSGAQRYLTAGIGYLSCNVSLPNGATVTALHASVTDLTTTGGVDCELTRGDAAGTPENLAATAYTGDIEVPGNTTLTTSAITNAVINNAIYGYFVRCYLTEATADLALNKVSVEYTVSGLPVE